MKLEEAIKQNTPFKNPWHRAVVNLIYTNNWLTNRQRQLFSDVDITLQQYNVLRILRGQHPNPISTSDIRERMLDHRSDVSRIVDRLVKKDFVVRRTCQEDKRLVDVSINDQGLQLLASLDPRDQELRKMLNTLSEEEAEQLNELLDKVRDSK